MHGTMGSMAFVTGTGVGVEEEEEEAEGEKKTG